MRMPVRVSAGPIGSGDREPFVEDRTSGDNGQGRSGESDGHRGETSRYVAEGLSRGVIPPGPVCPQLYDHVFSHSHKICKILRLFLYENGCVSDVF